VRGFEDGSGNVVAEKIRDAGGGGKDILQAKVTAKSGNLLTMLGIEVDLGGITNPNPPGQDPKLTNEETGAVYASFAAFLADVTPGRTIVKAKGVFDPVPDPDRMNAEEAEIED